MKMTPPTYYSWEVGTGPSAVTLNILGTGGNQVVQSCEVTYADGSVVNNCAGHDEVRINTADLAVDCVYDHKAWKGPNCCLGSYTFTKIITGEGAGTNSEVVDWGGNLGACISGPGKHSWSAHNNAGFPKPIIYFAENGLNETLKIEENLTKLFGNYSVAWHYGALDHTHTGIVDLVTTSSKPYAFAPIDDRDGSPLPELNDKLLLECMDSSFEVLHRIQLSVREWDTFTAFTTFMTSNGVSGNPDNQGVENGVACGYGFNQYDCNDRADFDDLLNAMDGDMSDTTDNYNTTTRDRFYWFPRDVVTD